MRERLQARLKELRAEFGSGQRMLLELEARQSNLKSTLLRISGAIQLIEEELANESPRAGNGDRSSAEIHAEGLKAD